MDKTELVRLVENAIQGDKEAFETICQEKARDVLYICIHFMGNRQDGEDAAQEVFLAMQKSIGRLKNPHAFPAWSNRLTAHVCSHMRRKRDNRKDTLQIEWVRESLEEINEEFLPEEFAEQTEKRQIVLDALQSLKLKNRQVLVLFYYENLTTKEIAHALDITPKAAERSLYHARAALKKKISKRLGAELEVGPKEIHAMGGSLVLTQILQKDAAEKVTKESTKKIIGAVGFGVGASAGGHVIRSLTPYLALLVTGSVATIGLTGILLNGGGMEIHNIVEPQAVFSVPPQKESYHQPSTNSVGASTAKEESPSSTTKHAESRQQNEEPPTISNEVSTAFSQEVSSNTDVSLPPESEIQSSPSSEKRPDDDIKKAPEKQPDLPVQDVEKNHIAGELVFVDTGGSLVSNVTLPVAHITLTLYLKEDTETPLIEIPLNEDGSFDFEAEPDSYLLGVEVPDSGYQHFSEEEHLEVAWGEYQYIHITDTEPPSGFIQFFDSEGNNNANSLVNAASCKLTVYDDTTTTATWRLTRLDGSMVARGSGISVDFTQLDSAQINRDGQYTITFVITDAAGNKTHVSRDFVPCKNQ